MYPSLYWSKAEGGPDDETKAVIDERRTTPHMYRAFPGFTFFGRTFLKRTPGRGDLVAFANEATAKILQKEGKDPSAGFIKRVIGLPGDTVELRDGFVYLNGRELSEPYIYKPRSTWGESYLKDCAPLQIPQGEVLVLGDNRKASSDSRGELGLIKIEDINFILPFREQSYYETLWRDTTQDASLAGTASLKNSEFYTLLNEVRKDHNLRPIKEVASLTQSAKAFGKGATLDNSLTQSGYPNKKVYGLLLSGAFSAKELLDNLLAFTSTSRQVLDPVITDIGLADLTTNINNCPGELVAIELGGYIPATYDPGVVASWQKLKEGLEENLTFWKSAVQYDSVDQDKLAKLIILEERRLALATEILSTMDKRQWLTKEQEARIKADEQDASAAEALTKNLVKN